MIILHQHQVDTGQFYFDFNIEFFYVTSCMRDAETIQEEGWQIVFKGTFTDNQHALFGGNVCSSVGDQAIFLVFFTCMILVCMIFILLYNS